MSNYVYCRYVLPAGESPRDANLPRLWPSLPEVGQRVCSAAAKPRNYVIEQIRWNAEYQAALAADWIAIPVLYLQRDDPSPAPVTVQAPTGPQAPVEFADMTLQCDVYCLQGQEIRVGDQVVYTNKDGELLVSCVKHIVYRPVKGLFVELDNGDWRCVTQEEISAGSRPQQWFAKTDGKLTVSVVATATERYVR